MATTYTIVPNSEVTQEMIDACLENSVDTLRHTISGTNKVILKWVDDTPTSLSSYTIYTYSEILTILNDENGDWYTDPNF